MSGIVNVIVGVLMIAAGLSGKFVLIGTHSGLALTVIGAIVAGLGVYRMIQGRGDSEG